VTADFCYIRLHGSCGKYQGSYDDGALEQWSRKIEALSQTLAAVYVYFR